MRESKEGFIYFILAPSVNRIKIGYTSSVSDRFARLKLMSPVPLEVMTYVRGSQHLESALLAIFHKHRLHGEWFSAHDDLLRYIKKLRQGEKIELDKIISN